MNAPTAPQGHSIYGMSVMERRIACPASANAERGRPNRPTAASERGTYLHEVAARALISQDPQAPYEPDDPEDAKVVVDYVDAVLGELMRYERMHVLGECGKPQLMVETKFHLDHIHDDLWGTTDAIILAAPWVHVFDLKTGGIMVPLVMHDGSINPQLGGYMLGAIRAVQKTGSAAFGRFRFTVVQPARGGAKTIEVTRRQLARLATDIDAAIEAAEAPNPAYVTGEHCTFCRAAGVCPKVREEGLLEAMSLFADEELLVPTQEAVDIASDDLARLIELGERVDRFLRAVRAEAFNRLNEGTPVPGLKLVAKQARRRWRDEAATIQRLQGEGLDADDLYTKKLKSPAQVEKLGKALKPIVADLAEAVSSGAKLVSEDHPSPAIPAGAAGVFTDASDE
jgi:hypothetical protein